MKSSARAWASLAASLAAGIAGWPVSGCAQALPLKLVADLPLGEPSRRFDYASVDPKAGLLFAADLSGGRVLVVDMRNTRLAKVLPDVAGAHGVLVSPERGQVYASATGSREIVVIDERTLAVTARIPAGRYPDGIALAPLRAKLYVSDETGKAVQVIDLATNRNLGSIPLGGEVGNTQYDTIGKLIYSNQQSTNELVAIDPAQDKIVGRWPLAGCSQAHGLLIDAARRVAYIACQSNAKLLAFSLKDHAITATQSVGAGPDVLAADLGLSRLYVAGEAGVVTVLDLATPDLKKLGQMRLADNAHVVAVDPATHRVYFPLRDVGGKAVLRVMEPAD